MESKIIPIFFFLTYGDYIQCYKLIPVRWFQKTRAKQTVNHSTGRVTRKRCALNTKLFCGSVDTVPNSLVNIIFSFWLREITRMKRLVFFINYYFHFAFTYLPDCFSINYLNWFRHSHITIIIIIKLRIHTMRLIVMS